MISAIITAAAAVTALGVLVALGRKLWLRLRGGLSKVGAAADALLGRDAVLHPDTGAELVPATPGLGVRLAGIEQQQSDLAGAVATMARTQADVAAMQKQVADLTATFHAHLTYADEHDRKVWDAIREITLRIPVPKSSEQSDAA